MPGDTGVSKKAEAMCKDIVNGETDELKLLETYGASYLKTYRGVQHCINLVSAKKRKHEVYQRTPRFKVCVWFGLAGAGKTWDAEQVAQDAGLSMWKADMDEVKRGWFQGYQGQDVILMDDFRGNVFKFHSLLQFLDKPRQLPVKGGYVDNSATYLFLTSPDHPVNWYRTFATTPNDWDQLFRRINNIYHAELVDDERKVTDVTKEDKEYFKREESTFVEYQPKFNK